MYNLFYSVKSALQVSNDIVDMFGTDRKADRVRLDALVGELFLGELAVRGGRGMDNKALDIRNICEQREDFEAINELMCFGYAALDLKGEDRRAAVWEILLIQCVVGMVGQRRMIYLCNLRMIYKELYDLFGIFGVALKPQRQCFGALQQQECVKRRD